MFYDGSQINNSMILTSSTDEDTSDMSATVVEDELDRPFSSITSSSRPSTTSSSLSSSSSSPPLRTSSRSNTILPSNYTPGDTDVICARGRAFWDHPGNVMYRELIADATPKYSNTTNKLEKTLIVSDIVQTVHRRKGRFIKRKDKRGPWMQVDETFSREKIGQSLRDLLSSKYRSATSVKKRRRTESNDRFHGDVDRVVRSNRIVTCRMDELCRQIECTGDTASEYAIMALFSRTNSDILETIKRDERMLNQFEHASVAAYPESCFY